MVREGEGDGMIREGARTGHTSRMAQGYVPEPDNDGIRRWTVAAALIQRDGELLLVHNRRRGGHSDWTTPGGVIEAGEVTLDGLSREVVEESGIVVHDWSPIVYSVEASAPGMGWQMRVETYRAVTWSGEIEINDPDGIVVDASFAPEQHSRARLAGSAQWVSEPLGEWLSEPWHDHRPYRYAIAGADRTALDVVRL